MNCKAQMGRRSETSEFCCNLPDYFHGQSTQVSPGSSGSPSVRCATHSTQWTNDIHLAPSKALIALVTLVNDEVLG